MGVVGFVWVRWGAGSMGGHKTKTRMGHLGLAGQDLGRMIGEISHDMMFHGFC